MFLFWPQDKYIPKRIVNFTSWIHKHTRTLAVWCFEESFIVFTFKLQVWKYGNEIQLLFSRQVVDDPEYVNYVEFNQAETHLIAHCITMGEEFLRFDGIIMVLSIHTGKIGKKKMVFFCDTWIILWVSEEIQMTWKLVLSVSGYANAFISCF